MSKDEWTPFGLTEDETDQYLVLVDGVPAWMVERLNAILSGVFSDSSGYVREQAMLVVQNETRLNLQVVSGQGYIKSVDLANRLRGMEQLSLLRLTDYVLSTSYPSANTAKNIEEVLRASKSKWRVDIRGAGKLGLVERVPEGVQSAVERTIRASGSAGSMLQRAWGKVHGIDSDDPGAYADAVKAVEIAAIAVVQKNKLDATLGTVLGQMKADGDWRLDLREHKDAPGPEMVLAMGRTLWFGHRDRHGSASYTDVTHEEARQAVALAATLVDWFSSGAIKRRP